MNILLVRPAFRNILAGTNLITVEPLDLEYLAAVAKEEGANAEIYDSLVTRRSLKSYLKRLRPAIVGITGYVTMKNNMLKFARMVKQFDPMIKVVIGGAHAELNYADFYIPEVDLIVHSGGVETFRQIIRLTQAQVDTRDDDKRAGQRTNSAELTRKLAQDGIWATVPGLCYPDRSGAWVVNERGSFDPKTLPRPDRSHFYRYHRRFKYLRHHPCAIVKTAYGCPFNCNFCYCCLMNNGKFAFRELTDVVAEIAEIDAAYIWIVDDTFLVERERVLEFLRLVKEHGIKRKYGVYSRADFVAQNPDLFPLLREIGVVDVIIGLEAVNDQKLSDYNKRSSDGVNRQAVRVLHEAGINCVGLFMLDIDARREDFRDLLRWVKENKLRYFVPSIFTPFPGTPLFAEYRDRLLTDNYAKWDLLHLVLKPEKLGKWRFYYEFYKIYGAMIWLNLTAGDFTWQYFFSKLPWEKSSGYQQGGKHV